VHMTVVTPVARSQSIAFLSSGAKEANDALESLTALYGNSPFDEADVIVTLGGDGLAGRAEAGDAGQQREGRGGRLAGGVLDQALADGRGDLDIACVHDQIEGPR